MLEDMEVGIFDLHSVNFKITEATSEEADSLQPTVSGRRWERLWYRSVFLNGGTPADFQGGLKMTNISIEMH